MQPEKVDDHFSIFATITSLEDLWETANAYIQKKFAPHNVLLGMPSIGRLPIFIRTALPSDESGADYWERLVDTVQLSAVAKMFPGLVASRMSDVFNPKANPQDQRLLDELSLNRREEQGDFTGEEMALLAEIQPHINAAVRRAIVSENQAQLIRSIDTSLDALPTPILLLNWQGAPLLINNAAKDILTHWSDESLAEGIALIYSAGEALRLERGKVRIQKTELSMEVQHPKTETLSALIKLIEPVDQAASLPTISVQLKASEELFPKFHYAVKNLEHLTPTELKVARLAASGYTNADIVSRLSVSESTVKTHLRSIFGKLNIIRRAQLGPLLRSR